MNAIERLMTAVVDKISIDREPFGKELHKVMAKQIPHVPFLHVPWIINRCTDIIVNGDVDSSLPMFSASYKKRVGKFPELSPLEASNVIKRFLSELPTPLLSLDEDETRTIITVLENFSLNSENSFRTKEIVRIIRKFSRFYQACLKEIFFVFYHLASQGKYGIFELASLLESNIGNRNLDTEIKKKLCLLLISDYTKIFGSIDKLRAGRTVTPNAAELKVISVYYDDGKECKVEVKTTASIQYLIRKLQSTLNITTDLHIYQILDRQIRKADNNELVTDLVGVWAGSLFFTPQILDISELCFIMDRDSTTSLSVLPEDDEELVVVENGTSISEFFGSSTGSFSDSKSPRLVSSYESGSGISPRLSDEYSPSMITRKADRNTHRRTSSGHTPPTSQYNTMHLGIGSSRGWQISRKGSDVREDSVRPLVHIVWIFEGIPQSNKAAEWEMQGTEGDLVISLTEGSQIQFLIKLKCSSKQWNFQVDELFSVADSSLYFVFVDNHKKNHPLGIGFQNRAAAGSFRSSVGHFYSIQKVTKPTISTSSSIGSRKKT